MKQIGALVAPRSVRLIAAGDRAKTELRDLKSWYKTLGADFDPLQ